MLQFISNIIGSIYNMLQTTIANIDGIKITFLDIILWLFVGSIVLLIFRSLRD